MTEHTIAGTVLTLPVRIRRATQHMAMFSVDADAAQAMVDSSKLRVCRYRPGRAIVVLMSSCAASVQMTFGDAEEIA